MDTLEVKYGDIIKKYCQNKLKGQSTRTLQYMQAERKVKEDFLHLCTFLENNGYHIVRK